MYLRSSEPQSGHKRIESLSRNASSSQCSESEESRIVPVPTVTLLSPIYRNPLSPDNLLLDKLENLPLRDDGIVHIESTVLPLDRAVDIECIAQPVVAASSVNGDTLPGPSHEPSLSPRLELLRAQRMGDILDGITETVSVVISRIDAPLVSTSLVVTVLDTVRYRVNLQ